MLELLAMMGKVSRVHRVEVRGWLDCVTNFISHRLSRRRIRSGMCTDSISDFSKYL
jgi:hypothetical protein